METNASDDHCNGLHRRAAESVAMQREA